MREKILEEVKKILHGPVDGIGEELDKNPLDFYSVGVLYPRLEKSLEYADSEPDTIEEIETTESEIDDSVISEDKSSFKRFVRELDETDGSEDFELTNKFRPSAAGISILASKGASPKVVVQFGTYEKRQIDKQTFIDDKPIATKAIVYKHILNSISIKYINGVLQFGDLKYRIEGGITYIDLNEKAFLAIAHRTYTIKSDSLEIITFTLINRTTVQSFKKQKKAEDCLFQPEIRISLEEGFHPFEDLSDLELLSDEDLNLKLLYRNYKAYALGHGISVNWTKNEGRVQETFTQVLPTEQVNGVDLNPEVFQPLDILYIKRLSGKSVYKEYDWTIIKDELEHFTNLYKKWIENQKEFLKTNPENIKKELISIGNRNVGKCDLLYDRMMRGINILTSNVEARKAFEDANRAMFMQRIMADFSKHRQKSDRVQHNTDRFDDPLPNYAEVPYNASSLELWKDGKLSATIKKDSVGRTLARWRPFQLAFLLSQVEGIVDPFSNDRDSVDLIWFPTGGGKTEAYLGLTAFTIFYRRLNSKKLFQDPDKGAGVTVLMRYTLRLLNKQQFERASILICACEIIRNIEVSQYGKTRISNGIWMGRSMTPNNENDQRNDYQDYIKHIDKAKEPNTFKNSPPILSCPCCGNRLVRDIVKGSPIGRWGYFRERNARNIETGRYLISCTNTKCDFYTDKTMPLSASPKTFPIYEVDETIYRERPTLLFSTVDKFVQLAWKTESFNIFNLEFGENKVKRIFPSPELIIQDELHLISSALGTIYGVYEIVVDKLCREIEGNPAKIVGATATVRNAETQCRRLYGRNNFMQFPPPATNADDAFYAVKITDVDPKNRLYVGFMPSGITTSTALIRLSSVLLERIPTLPFNNEELDNFYTLVVYFNSLRELGKFRTFLTDDIVAYRKLLANFFNTFIKPYNNNTLCELSSVMTADDITKGLDRLEKTTLPRGLDPSNILIKTIFNLGVRTFSDFRTAKGRFLWKDLLANKALFNQVGLTHTANNEKDYKNLLKKVESVFGDEADPVHVAPATNMISVGVDIPRLNTMIINGQPKTTAEYIQASSRIGRDQPGIVFTFLAPTKNRDRSHYEQFKAFHQAYYYFVESTSVTPFSGPALEKVLPTVLIALTRSLYLNGNEGVFASQSASYLNFIDQIISEVKSRGVAIYGQAQKNELHQSIDRLRNSFVNTMSNLAGDRKLAKYSDFMEWDQLTGQIISTIKNPDAVYNAPAQFVESILHEHVSTMQTLRNVESSTSVHIKSH